MKSNLMKFSRMMAFFLLFGFLNSCGNLFSVDVTDIPSPNLKIIRYEQALFGQELTSSRIDTLQQQFPLFLGDMPLDSIQMRQLLDYVADPFLSKLFSETERVFPNLNEQELELSKAFQHIRYYYPNFEYPVTYSYISGVQDIAFYQDQIVLISLDHFLGSGHEAYQMMGTPKYKQFSMQKSFLTKEVLMAIAQYYVPPISADAKLLEQMIYEAKLLFFIKSMSPNISDEVLFNQTKENLSWLEKKESDLWKYYIENELLYKTDYLTYNKFINDAPFTSVLGDDSAPRTGVWLGYQIVFSYMKNNEIELNAMLQNQDAQQILIQSTYKPNRN